MESEKWNSTTHEMKNVPSWPPTKNRSERKTKDGVKSLHHNRIVC
jgi:hypothetical protein